DQIRHLFPDLRLTPLCFFEEWWTDRCMPPPGLSKAADFFGLDLSKSEQRALLLDILADVIFGEQKKGRPPAKKAKWDRLRLIQLAVDCNKVKAGYLDLMHGVEAFMNAYQGASVASIFKGSEQAG